MSSVNLTNPGPQHSIRHQAGSAQQLFDHEKVDKKPTMSKLIRIAIIALLLVVTGATAVNAQSDSPDDGLPTEPLRVVTKEIEPFVFLGDELSGFSIDLWEELAQAAGFEYEFVVVETVTDQLNTVEQAEADAAMAAISITKDREQTVDFSFSFFNSGLGILAAQSDRASVWNVLRSGDFIIPLLELFAFLTLVIVIAGHVIWLLERQRDADFPKSYVKGVWEGIWWAAVTVTTVGYGDKTPRGIFGRTFGLIWMFAGLFIIANFTANVTSRLTVEQIEGAINGPQDLPGKIVVTVEGSTAAAWLTRENISHRTVTVIEDAYELLEDGRAQAVVFDYPVLLFYALNFGDSSVEVVGAPFNDEDYGIAFPTGSPLREEFNQALLQVREDGTYDRLYMEWFGDQ